MATGTQASGTQGQHAEHSPEEFKKHIKGYWVVFGALLVLTAVTVGVAYLGDILEWGTFATVTVALIVATIKASLVCLYFMHLIDERKLIYWTLLLVAVMAVPLFALPNMTEGEVGDQRIRMEERMPGTESHDEEAGHGDESGHGDAHDHDGHAHEHEPESGGHAGDHGEH